MARLLVVEDVAPIREFLAALLVEEGHEVYTAADGVEALATLRRSPVPLVVLLDVLMPRVTGVAILRLVGQGEPSLIRHAYVLVTATASALPHDVVLLVHQLEVPIVAKPFDVQDLLRIVQATITRQFLQAEATGT